MREPRLDVRPGRQAVVFLWGFDTASGDPYIDGLAYGETEIKNYAVYSAWRQRFADLHPVYMWVESTITAQNILDFVESGKDPMRRAHVVRTLREWSDARKNPGVKKIVEETFAAALKEL